ncbi:MAG: hypothetical protein FWG37_02280 [Clostridia bacterium]|nr:hypothetical protein [Clostridia bacterium]
MRRIMHTFTAIFVSLLLCLPTPLAAQAQSLLGDRLAQAYDAGRRVEASVRFDPDDSLSMLGLLPPEDFASVQELLRTLVISVSVARPETKHEEIGFELRLADTSIASGCLIAIDDTLAVTTNLLPGKTLIFDAAEIIGGVQDSVGQLSEQFDGLQGLGEDAEAYLSIIMQWIFTEEGLISSTDEGTPRTEHRGASVETYTLRVTPDQLKRLLTALVEELSDDEAILQTLPIDMSTLDQVEQLVPTDNAMEWVVQMDEDGEIVGIAGTVPTLFGEGAQVGTFDYAHLAEDGIRKHSVTAGFVDPDVSKTDVFVSINSDAENPDTPSGRLSVLYRQVDADTATEFMLQHMYASTLATSLETLESRTKIDLQSRPSSLDAEFSAGEPSGDMDGTPDFSAAFDFQSETTAREGQDDFRCESSLGIELMGMTLGRVLVTLESAAYIPSDTAGNETVVMADLDGDALEALLQELNEGLFAALGRVMTVMPPELMMFFQ